MKSSTPDSPKLASPRKILLMGPPGARKTTLLLQFPNVHVLDCDRNLDGPEQFLRAKGIPLSYTYDDIRHDDNGLPVETHDCYNRLCDKLKLFSKDPAYKARTCVGVDSLSHVNEFIIRHVLKKQGTSMVMEARDWSPFKSYAYALFVSRLEETGKTVICTAHEQKVYGKADATNMMNPPVDEYEPFFQGKIGEMLGAFFTDVWRMEVRQAPGKLETWLIADKAPKLPMLKNSVGLPRELNITEGFKVLEPYLKGKIW